MKINLKRKFRKVNIFVARNKWPILMFLSLFILVGSFSFTYFVVLNKIIFRDSQQLTQEDPETRKSKVELPITLAIQDQDDFEVIFETSEIIKENRNAYIQNKTTGEKELFVSFPGYPWDCHPTGSYKNGNLYLRKCFSEFPNGFGLWRYNSKKENIVLYSSNGFNFDVSDDEQLIVIRDHSQDKIHLLDNAGAIIATYEDDEVAAHTGESIEFYKFFPRSVWFYDFFDVKFISGVDLNTLALNVYDLEALPIGREFVLNDQRKIIAFTDYPVLNAGEETQAFESSGLKVTLFIYDLELEKLAEISNVVAKKFEPKWLDDQTLEYNDPDGSGRLTYKIP